jgi:hypothetical protein
MPLLLPPRSLVLKKSVMTRWATGMHSRLPWQSWNPERRLSLLLLIIILLLLFGGGGGYYGYSRWGRRGGLGVVGTVLLILLVLYLPGALR